MIGRTEGLLMKEVLCAAPVAAYTIATFGADDNTYETASSPEQPLIGVFEFATKAAGLNVRLALDGIAHVTIAGSVNRGDRITSNGYGQGITADPSPGENMNVIGIAMNSGTAPAIIVVLIHQDMIQG
jgi:hypothetical protein